jgi:hypothetical protein
MRNKVLEEKGKLELEFSIKTRDIKNNSFEVFDKEMNRTKDMLSNLDFNSEGDINTILFQLETNIGFIELILKQMKNVQNIKEKIKLLDSLNEV